MEKGKNLLTKLSEKLGKAKNKVSGAFKKIKEQFKRTGVKVAATVLSLAVCASVAFTVVNAASNIKPESTDPEIEIETTIDNAIGELTPELTFKDQELAGSHGNKNEPNQSPSIEEEIPSIEEAPINESQLNSFILKNDEYNKIISNSEGTESSKHETFYEMDPHPYAFLKSQGHNIDAIKNGTNYCYSISYTLDNVDNSVFIASKIHEHNVSTHYIIEYKLSDTDMKFFKKVNSSQYYQAAFINDAISQLYQPVNVSSVKLTQASCKALDETFATSFNKTLGCNYSMLFVSNVSSETNVVTLNAVPMFKTTSNIDNESRMKTVEVKSYSKIHKDNDAYRIIPGALLESVSSDVKIGVFNQAQDVNFLLGFGYYIE